MSLVRRAPRSARFVSFGSSVRPVVSASSLNHQRWASTAAPKSGAPADKSATSSTKELTLSEQLDLILPFEWDLEYLKKFEIAPPTSEQMAKSIPAPEVEGVIGRAGQLASDLFEIAYIYEKLQDIGDELGEILQFSKDNAGFADRIVDKGYTKTEQRELFEKLFQKSSPLLKKFVARMVENNDLHRILQVAENYQELLRAYRKEVHVVLALAKIPPPARLESIKSRAAFYYLPRGVTPVWDIQERPELIEGYTLSTKELSVDVSAAGRQKKIKERLEKIFQKAEAATIKPPALGMPMYPIVIRQGDEIQQLAASLKERADEQIQLDEVHYNIHFVEWA